jgi:hypothetical protein
VVIMIIGSLCILSIDRSIHTSMYRLYHPVFRFCCPFEKIFSTVCAVYMFISIRFKLFTADTLWAKTIYCCFKTWTCFLDWL